MADNGRYATMLPLKGFANYSAAQLAALTHSTERNARRWRAEGAAPPLVVEYLTLTHEGRLGALSAHWKGWIVRGRALHSPEGLSFEPGELNALPYRYAQLKALERDVRELRAQSAPRAAITDVTAELAEARSLLARALTKLHGQAGPQLVSDAA